LHTKETVLRPGVAGGLVGAGESAGLAGFLFPVETLARWLTTRYHNETVNVAVLGAVGYLSYKNWNLPRWDRQTVSSVVVGLVALSAAEGWVLGRLGGTGGTYSGTDRKPF
jgi:uncharacterized membrane protein YebE (DUF533 family)